LITGKQVLTAYFLNLFDERVFDSSSGDVNLHGNHPLRLDGYHSVFVDYLNGHACLVFVDYLNRHASLDHDLVANMHVLRRLDWQIDADRAERDFCKAMSFFLDCLDDLALERHVVK
jgi:hypothetical protein